MLSPLEQFEIFNILGNYNSVVWLSLVLVTNNKILYYVFMISNLFFTIFLFLILACIANIVIFFKNKLIPLNWLFLYYLFLIVGNQIIKDLIVNIKGKINFFTLFLFLFMLLIFLNVTGLIPYTFVLTSQFVFTFTLAFLYFFCLNLTGIYYHGFRLLNLFFPAGTPLAILPLLILIEFISYFARMFSLAIRLFANITAGHILLKILSWFTYLLFDIFFIGLLGFVLITCLWGLEFFISLLQAYVFLILLCIYLNDVLTLH